MNTAHTTPPFSLNYDRDGMQHPERFQWGVIMAKIGRDGPQTRGPLRKALPSRDREYFDDAAALLVTAHQLADVLDGHYSAA